MKQMSYITRWLYSTSHKDIAILYLGYGLISSMVATGMSVIIRMELSGPNPQFLNENNQVFNVMVTGHAIAMIFLFVMPVLIGAFGKKRIYKYISFLKYKNILNIGVKPYNHAKRGNLVTFKSIFIPYVTKDNKIFTVNKSKINKELSPQSEENNLHNNLLCNKIILPLNMDKNYLGSYLAGLIEGDGSIWVDEGKYKQKTSPAIDIIFVEKDLPLLNYLFHILNIGYIKHNRTSKAYMWHIKKIEDIYVILELTNGYYRTPKYEASIRAINWLNNYILEADKMDNKLKRNNKGDNFIEYNNKIRNNILKNINIINIKPIDTSNLWSNPWLAGFTDADGNFSISLYKRKNNNINVGLYYRLEIRQRYTKVLDINNNKIDVNYFDIMTSIANMFNTNLYSRKRNLKLQNQENYKDYYSYIVAVTKIENLSLVVKYFEKYPLLSSKYLDYKDWKKIIDLAIIKGNKPSHIECKELAIKIRNNFNKTRKNINWDHLK